MCISTSLQTQGTAPGAAPSDLIPGVVMSPASAPTPVLLMVPVTSLIMELSQCSSPTHELLPPPRSVCTPVVIACSAPSLHGRCLLFAEHLHGLIPFTLLLGISCCCCRFSDALDFPGYNGEQRFA